MRLIDRILAGEKVICAYGSQASAQRPNWDLRGIIQRNIKGLEVIVADNVMDYIYGELTEKCKEKGGTINRKEEFPCIAPPFHFFWIEAYANARVGIAQEHHKVIGCPSRSAVGALCIAAGASDWVRYLAKLLDDKSSYFDNLHKDIADLMLKYPEVNWPLLIIPVTETNSSGYLGQHPAIIMPIGKNGEQCGFSLLSTHGPDAYYDADIKPKLAQEASQVANTVQWLVSATVAFMHCKNVAQVEVKPSVALNKAKQRRGKPPLVRYKVLNIAPMSEVLRRQGGLGSGNGLAKAMHICRGHFKTYSTDKPLLGKVSGRFWWPQHARGNAASGIIVKDYAAGNLNASVDGLTDAQRWARAAALVEGKTDEQQSRISKRNLGKTAEAPKSGQAKKSQNQNALLGVVRLSQQ